jgi:adenine-specific DNA glycosylase
MKKSKWLRKARWYQKKMRAFVVPDDTEEDHIEANLEVLCNQRFPRCDGCPFITPTHGCCLGDFFRERE